MNQHDLIFSKGRYRVLRHLFFWIAWIIFAAMVQLTNIFSELEWTNLIKHQLVRTLVRIPSHILFCYATVFFLLPIFIPEKKYKQFFFPFLLFAILLYWLNYSLLTPTYNLPAIIVGEEATGKTLFITPFLRKFLAFYSNINFTGAIPACCLMLSIKYYKDWYKKQTESELLIQENNLAELQLLKAQIHPHFLFNTLNNIYSFILTGLAQAEGLVNKLSGMIDYIITEGAKAFVPVEKEIHLLKDYIGLEKVRYGDRLDLQLEINGDYKNKMIAPLLVISSVENCFKHRASVMRGEQWIKMSIEVNANQLDFNLSNSKPQQGISSNNKKGIGLTNVQKRLQLLYPQNHSLEMINDQVSFSVHLKINLTEPITHKNFHPMNAPVFSYEYA